MMMYYDLFLPKTITITNTSNGMQIELDGKKAQIYAAIDLGKAYHCLCTEEQFKNIKQLKINAYDFSAAIIDLKTAVGGPCHTFGNPNNGVKWIAADEKKYIQRPDESTYSEIKDVDFGEI